MAAPPRFEHGFEAPQASVISKLHYRAELRQLPPQYKREGSHLLCSPRVHVRSCFGKDMAIHLERKVEFSMVDLAQIAYYPRIFDLAHRFFEQTWPSICGQEYPHIIYERRLGFPVVHVESSFLHPIAYGDTVSAKISIQHIGNTSLKWHYQFSNQHGQDLWASSQTTVCVDMDSMQPTVIPDDIRQGLQQHLLTEDQG